MDFKFKVNIYGTINDYQETSPKDITIPEKIDEISVRKVSRDVFQNKTIENIFIPKNIKELDIKQFQGCEKLRTVVFDKDSKNTTIPEYCFSDAFNFRADSTELILPDSIKTIDFCAFERSGVKSVILGSGTVNINDYTFYSSRISSLDFKRAINLCVIGKYAFANCGHLNKIDLSDFSGEINYSAFDRSNLKELILGDYIQYINATAFDDTPIQKEGNIKWPYFSNNLRILKDEGMR